MTEIAFSLPDEAVDALAKGYGYPETVTDPETGGPVANPQTKAGFVHDYYLSTMQAGINAQQERDAMDAARQSIQPITLS